MTGNLWKSLLTGLATMSGVVGFGVPPVNYYADDTDFEVGLDAMASGPFGYGTLAEARPANFDEKKPWYEHDKTTGCNSSGSLKLINGATRCPVPVILPKGTYTYSCYMKSDIPNGRAVFMMLKQESVFQGPQGILARRGKEYVEVGKEWKRYTMKIEADGVTGYVPYVGGWNRGWGTIWVDRVMINRGENPEPWQSAVKYRMNMKLKSVYGNVHPFDKELDAELHMVCYGDQLPREPLRVQIADFYGKMLKEYKITPEFKDGHFHKEIVLPTGKSGWFKVDATMDGMPNASMTYVLTRPPEKVSPSIEPFVGLYGVQDIPEAGRLLGVSWVDLQESWRGSMNDKNEYVSSSMELAPRLHKAGYRIKINLSPSPPEHFLNKKTLEEATKVKIAYTRLLPEKDTVETLWRSFMQDYMKKMNGNVDKFEIGGEVDSLYGLSTYYKSLDKGKNMVGNYVTGESMEVLSHCIRVAAEEILKVNPTAKISGVRPCDCDCRDGFIYSNEVFKRCGQYLNTFAVDCYPNPRWIGPGRPAAGTEEPLAFVYEKGTEAMKKYCKGSEMYVAEFGYFIDYRYIFNPKYYGEQANRLLRNFLKAKALGFAQFYYFLAIGSAGGNEGQYYYFGIWWNASTPLPAVATLATAERVVDNVDKAEEIPLKSDIGATVYHKIDGRAVGAFWAITSAFTPTLEVDANTFEAMDAMGNPISLDRKGSKLIVPLTEMPVFLWSTEQGKDNYTILRNAMKNTRIQNDIPIIPEFRCESKDTLKVYVRNLSLNKVVKGNARFAIPDTGKTGTVQFSLSPASTQIVRLPMPPNGKTIETIFDFGEDYLPVTKKFTPELIRVVRVSGLNLDGTLESWKAVKPVIVSGSSRIQPMDGTTYNGPDDLSAKMYFAHDGEYFYFAADVTDDRHFNVFKGAAAWDGDCIQFAFDPETNHSEYVKGFDPDDSMCLAALTGEGETFHVYRSPNRTALRKGTSFKIIRDEETKRTLYQLKIPIAAIGANLKTGSIFGFNCCVFDDDSGAKADYWLYLSYGLAGGINPALFAQCLLE